MRASPPGGLLSLDEVDLRDLGQVRAAVDREIAVAGNGDLVRDHAAALRVRRRTVAAHADRGRRSVDDAADLRAAVAGQRDADVGTAILYVGDPLIRAAG